MIKLSEFKSKITQLARPNRFRVEIHLSDSLKGVGKFSEDYQYTVQGAVIPNRTQGSIPIKYYGRIGYLPGDYEHQDLTLTFINTWDWKVRRFFEEWMGTIQVVVPYNDNNFFKSLDVIGKTTIKVHQLGNNGETGANQTYTFYNVFPKELSEIKLSMDNENSIETFDVTFAYSEWY